MRAQRTLPSALCAVLVAASTLVAITADEKDDFEDGTTEAWGQGVPSGLVSNVPDGGPAGAGDSFMRVAATGIAGPGGRLAVFNESQWSGDYQALGNEVTLAMDLINLGPEPLEIRVGVQSFFVPGAGAGGIGGEQWISTASFSLPVAEGAVSGWQNATFTLSEAEMTQVNGSQPLVTTLASVNQLRIVSAVAPDFMGDAIAGVLGIDNIEVLSVPVGLQSFTVE